MHICYYCIHTAYIGLHVCTYILAYYWPYKIKIQLTSLAVLVFSYLDENKPPLLQISVWLCSSSTIFLAQPQLEKLESLVRSFCQNLSHSPSGIHPLLKGKGRKVLLRKMLYFRKLYFCFFLKCCGNLFLMINYFMNLILLNSLWVIKRSI